MSNITDNYKLIVDRLEHIIYDNIVVKLASYSGFNKSLNDDYEGSIKSFPLLFYIVESLQVDNVLTVYKIVHNREERTIHYLLKYAKENISILSTKYPNLSTDILIKHEKALADVAEHVNRIKTQRDKYYAHSDKEYFLEPGNLLMDFPNTYDDLVNISIKLQGVISDHREIVYGNRRVCISDFVYLNTFRTIEFLKDASKEWHNKYRPNEPY